MVNIKLLILNIGLANINNKKDILKYNLFFIDIFWCFVKNSKFFVLKIKLFCLFEFANLSHFVTFAL